MSSISNDYIKERKISLKIPCDNLIILDSILDLVEAGHITEISILNFLNKIGLENIDSKDRITILHKVITVCLKMPMSAFNNRNEVRLKALDNLRKQIKGQIKSDFSFINPGKKLCEYC